MISVAGRPSCLVLTGACGSRDRPYRYAHHERAVADDALELVETCAAPPPPPPPAGPNYDPQPGEDLSPFVFPTNGPRYASRDFDRFYPLEQMLPGMDYYASELDAGNPSISSHADAGVIVAGAKTAYGRRGGFGCGWVSLGIVDRCRDTTGAGLPDPAGAEDGAFQPPPDLTEPARRDEPAVHDLPYTEPRLYDPGSIPTAARTCAATLSAATCRPLPPPR
jgi:hypothetical protein